MRRGSSYCLGRKTPLYADASTVAQYLLGNQVTKHIVKLSTQVSPFFPFFFPSRLQPLFPCSLPSLSIFIPNLVNSSPELADPTASSKQIRHQLNPHVLPRSHPLLGLPRGLLRGLGLVYSLVAGLRLRPGASGGRQCTAIQTFEVGHLMCLVAAYRACFEVGGSVHVQELADVVAGMLAGYWKAPMLLRFLMMVERVDLRIDLFG